MDLKWYLLAALSLATVANSSDEPDGLIEFVIMFFIVLIVYYLIYLVIATIYNNTIGRIIRKLKSD